jgi:hypothetical protein
MHHLFDRVIVLLNDLDNIDTLLRRGVEFSRKHETSLEILYVHEEPLFAVPDFFLSEENRGKGQIDKSKIKDKIQEHLELFDSSKNHAILVYIDDTVERLLNHAKDVGRTLVVTNYHKTVSSSLLEKTSYSFWINRGVKEVYKNIVFPINLKEESKKCIEATQHIFPESKLSLVYDYRYLLDVLAVREDYLNVVPITTGIDYTLHKKVKAENEETFESYKKEFNVDGTFIEGEGLLHEDLVEYIKEKSFDLTILYHSDDELFFSPVLILALLEALETDFFICKS